MKGLDTEPDNPKLNVDIRAKHDDHWRLTPHGVNEAKRVGHLYFELLNQEPCMPHLFASPLFRSIESAVHLSKDWEPPSYLWNKGVPDRDAWTHWNIDPNLRERTWGEMYLSWNQFKQRYPNDFQAWLDDPVHFKVPTGESLTDVRSRVYAFLQRLDRICTYNSFVVVVGHTDWILTCRSIIEDLDPLEFKKRFPDFTYYPGHFDGVLYNAQKLSYSPTSGGWPERMRLIKFPGNITSLMNCPDFPDWEEIKPKRYSVQDMEALLK